MDAFLTVVLVSAGGALLGIGAVSWYMYHNKTLPGNSWQLRMCFHMLLAEAFGSLRAFVSGHAHIAASWTLDHCTAEHAGQTSNKAAWQQISGPTHENTDTSKPKGPEQSSKEAK